MHHLIWKSVNAFPTTNYKFKKMGKFNKILLLYENLRISSCNFSSKRNPRFYWPFTPTVALQEKNEYEEFLSRLFMNMSNTCVARFSGVHRASIPLLVRKKIQVVFIRYFSTCAFHSPAPLIYPHPLFALNTRCHLARSDAPQRSDEWFSLRRDKLTTSTFSTTLGMWKGNRRYELWLEKVFSPDEKLNEAPGKKVSAMEWGVLNESVAIEKYKSITGREVGSLGFAVHSEERFDWIGASPDGILGGFPGGGILEVKCPFNKGKPETMLPWSTMPFYYMPQVQGQMEVMDRDWVDLYCWTPNGSTIFRVVRERSYWELMHGVLREFWWENVLPAREALLLGREEEAKSFKPESVHKLTGLVIFKSLKLAGEAKLLCREIAGHVEYLR